MIGQKIPKLTVTEEQRAYDACTERDQGRCQRCGLWGPTDRDHRQGRTAWNTTPANLHLLGGAFGCQCHVWKTLNPADAVRQGFAVPRWADPLEWPAYRYGVRWVLYFDEPVDGEWWRVISNAEVAQRMEGWTPVEYRDGRLFYLLDDGGLDEIDTTPI